MRPIKVEFQAFGPYVGHEEVNFEKLSRHGLFLICGKTGIGKTMILDAMTFALYGKSSGHGRDDFMAMRCTNADDNTNTYVNFEFENNGVIYKFERRLEKKRVNYSASYNIMKKDDDGIWRTISDNPKEKFLNEKAVEIIGLEYDQFRQVIVLPQGQFEKLLTSNSDEKEKILTSIFGEDRWQIIAEYVFANAEQRKAGLKEKKDRISNSLREEKCETMDQLNLLIEQKRDDIDELDANNSIEEYDKIIEKQNANITLANRFGDLDRAKEKVERLKNEKEKRNEKEKILNDALRANKVRRHIEAVSQATSEQKRRKEAEDQAVFEASKARKEAEVANTQLEDFKSHSKEIEKKKELKIRYEGKRLDYENISAVQEELAKKELVEEAAKEAERKAREKYEEISLKLTELRDEYNNLSSTHSDLLNGYLKGITGEIAKELEEGKPCPVCGSTTHPKKAIISENNVTKKQVDDAKAKVDKKYKDLDNVTLQQADAKNEMDKEHTANVNAHMETIAVKSRFDEMKGNLIKGIDTLDALEKQISMLGKEIEEYTNRLLILEKESKEAKENFIAKDTKISQAQKETKKADDALEKGVSDLNESLRANKFGSVDEAKSLLFEDDYIDKLKEEVTKYDADVEAANEALKGIKEELKGKKEPDTQECMQKRKEASDAKTEYVSQRGIISKELERLEMKQNRLLLEGEGIEEEIREAEEDYAFAKKLRGDSGTGLQRYVLGIMFSSVVAAANKMLEKVHGGRYRLFRSDDKAQGTNKRGLELKVFDKNSEDHEGRFVGTLSGGEKFLASLALSIGMSTVAQKSGIKIEALFIDEGFGSLDEDSIGDAMDILNSIQEANGIVGIISHVQLLQDRIPTKLKVSEVEKGSHIVHSIG